MSSEIKILRLSTGEDVIVSKVGENDQGISLNKAFVIMLNKWHGKTCSIDDVIV